MLRRDEDPDVHPLSLTIPRDSGANLPFPQSAISLHLIRGPAMSAKCTISYTNIALWRTRKLRKGVPDGPPTRFPATKALFPRSAVGWTVGTTRQSSNTIPTPVASGSPFCPVRGSASRWGVAGCLGIPDFSHHFFALHDHRSGVSDWMRSFHVGESRPRAITDPLFEARRITN
jgi:hypothetical protein